MQHILLIIYMSVLNGQPAVNVNYFTMPSGEYCEAVKQSMLDTEEWKPYIVDIQCIDREAT